MDTFAALADRTRRNIVEALAAGEQGFGDLADRFEMSRPAVSQHLKVLREAGLIRVRAEAQRRIYRLDDDALGEVERWLDRVRQFWNPRLDELERVLKKGDENNE
ncbi:MAG: metalloregulator ArsR/SmtB family transcription factor [Woeseiaceae bacterium]|nr:metalloregulator ArsR/SmtB family transcription factor [Woeseiaceae bacterium]